MDFSIEISLWFELLKIIFVELPLALLNTWQPPAVLQPGGEVATGNG
jgi:hypothetical protein